MQNSYWAMMRNSCIINSFSLDHLVIFDSFNALLGNECIDAISTNQCRMSTILVSEAYFNTLFLMFGRFVFWFSYSTMATWEVNFYCFCRSSTTKDIFLIWIMYSDSFKMWFGDRKKCPKNFFYQKTQHLDECNVQLQFIFSSSNQSSRKLRIIKSMVAYQWIYILRLFWQYNL